MRFYTATIYYWYWRIFKLGAESLYVKVALKGDNFLKGHPRTYSSQVYNGASDKIKADYADDYEFLLFSSTVAVSDIVQKSDVIGEDEQTKGGKRQNVLLGRGG